MFWAVVLAPSPVLHFVDSNGDDDEEKKSRVGKKWGCNVRWKWERSPGS